MASEVFTPNNALSIRSSGITFTRSGCAQARRTRSNSSARRLDKINLAPRPENAYANASPIPEDAPVIQTTLSVKSWRIEVTLRKVMYYYGNYQRHSSC